MIVQFLYLSHNFPVFSCIFYILRPSFFGGSSSRQPFQRASRMIRDWISPVTELHLSLQRIVEGCCPATRRKAGLVDDGVVWWAVSPTDLGLYVYIYNYITM